MRCLLLLSTMSLLLLGEESGSEAVTSKPVQLPHTPEKRDGGDGQGDGGRSQGDGGWGGGIDPHQRKKRSWVWNQFFVLEEFTGDEPLYVGKLHSDIDKGDGQIKYILTGEGAMSIFTIDERTGDIHATKRLDREQQAYFTLRAQARDRKTDLPVEPDSQFIIKVQDINDNEPKFLDGPYNARVPERSPVGTSVVTVVATDDDDPTYGNSARVVYSLLQGAPFFTVEPNTGVVRTALSDMDRERRDGYLLVVQAKDMIGQLGGLTGTTSVTVTLTDVNDNPPHFPRKSYQFIVSESAGVSSVAARIRALDVDVGVNAEIDYRILDGDPQGTFHIMTDSNTQEGVIIITKVLDFETVSSYLLHVEASNRFVDSRFQALGPFSDVTLVRLLVENVDEPPVFSLVSQMMISEAATVGTKVGSVSARDPDKINSPVRYSIDLNSDLHRYFNIDGVSGWISTARTLDRENMEVHNLTVMATEILDLSQVGKSVVLVSVMDVNDNPPHLVVDDQTFVCEDAPLGQVIETLSAMDPDDPGNGHYFLYSLSAKDAGNLSFSLRDNQDNTASILTRRAGFLRRDQPIHVLSVVVSDGGDGGSDGGHSSLSSTTTLYVTVCDCDALGHRRSCSQAASPRLAGFSMVSTAAVLTCILIVLCVVMVTPAVGYRGRERVMASDGEREVRENIICYDDEGGGEEDTEAFDMFTLRSLNQPNHPRHDPAVTPPPHVTQDGGSDRKLFQVLMWDRLQKANQNKTGPPYDSLQTYAFEGTGSAVDSLSSLNSLSSSGTEHNYDFLKLWGPRFKKLSDLYVQHERGRSLSVQSTESSTP